MTSANELADQIDEKFREVQQAENYYEVLGVERDASEEEIRSTFRKAAKKWHADRYGDELDEAEKKKVRKIFSALNSAHETLSDPDEREEYDRALETGDADIESVIDAESSFRRGRNLLDAGRYEGAHEQFKEACELSPENEPEYRAHRLYTEYQLIQKDSEGRPKDRERAREIFDELDDIHDRTGKRKAWLFAFMGQVAKGLRRNAEAEDLFKEAKMLDSDNTMAQRQLRLIRMRREKEDEGLLDSILSSLPFLDR
ncbi:MAG: DnaJ domain-containing protein [Bradymonadaceae bacterium]